MAGSWYGHQVGRVVLNVFVNVPQHFCQFQDHKITGWQMSLVPYILINLTRQYKAFLVDKITQFSGVFAMCHQKYWICL